ncbi:hypothetical protein [Vibrio phage RYC]|nr:hypothetical protein [Vibrio phage RYC]
MTFQELRDLVENNISRGITLYGFGCVQVIVPEKDVDKIAEELYYSLPTNVHVELASLKDNKLSLKKGEYAGASLSIQSSDDFYKVVDKYFPKGIITKKRK